MKLIYLFYSHTHCIDVLALANLTISVTNIKYLKSSEKKKRKKERWTNTPVAIIVNQKSEFNRIGQKIAIKANDALLIN